MYIYYVDRRVFCTFASFTRNMESDGSDEEPLAGLALAKKTIKDTSLEDDKNDDDHAIARKAKKRKKKKDKKEKLKITLRLKLPNYFPKMDVEPPTDVWLYLKDLNPCGPYSCLLCSEWFINRSKLVIHYILNHKKEYCGICRYLVTDRETWITHLNCHIPWQCSHCTEQFLTDIQLREHFSSVHQYVHCRLCYFMISVGNEYHSHLTKKHNVTQCDNKENEVLWQCDYPDSPRFTCLLCLKHDIASIDFFRHFMCYHKFTLKCFTSVLSSCDVPFSVYGAHVSASFLHNELSQHVRYGYIDRDNPTKLEPSHTVENLNLLQALYPEIKQEDSSDNEEENHMLPALSEKCKTELNEIPRETDVKSFSIMPSQKDYTESIHNSYEGTEDYDISVIELININLTDVHYVDEILNDLREGKIPKISQIALTSDNFDSVSCPVCKIKLDSQYELNVHVTKIHFFKTVLPFTCRVCLATFESDSDLQIHCTAEYVEFENLYLCQFCDDEFDTRAAGRTHLTSHWFEIQDDNCMSPQFGFKCRYCSCLFWNETDREKHHCLSHLEENSCDFFKCSVCNKLFSDKVWFVNHLSHHSGVELENTKCLFRCSLCTVVLENLPKVREHFSFSHPDAKKLYCKLNGCQSKPFSALPALKIHLRNAHSEDSRANSKSSCTVCGREFASWRAVATHMAHAHTTGRHKCKLCSNVFQSADERKLHYMLRHPGRAPHECVSCDKAFQNKSSLYLHRTQNHGPESTHICSYCSKQFTNKESLKEHILIHEGPRHACSYCPMQFVQRSNMLRHERRHTGERPYTCLYCSRTFADKGACNSHMKTHTRDQVHTCPYCSQTFLQKPKLKYHMRRHTGENLETCPVCSKLFTSACSLREHMRIHNRSENVACPECSKVFTSSRYMLRHVRTAHLPITELACPLCDKLLINGVRLRQHVMTHSKIKSLQCLTCSKRYCGLKSIEKHIVVRHKIKGGKEILKSYYSQLDPRECKLDLTEEMITKIFGPVKSDKTEVLIGDYITFPKGLPLMIKKEIVNNEDENTKDETESDYEEYGSKFEPDSSESENEPFTEEPISMDIVKQNKRSKTKIITYGYDNTIEQEIEDIPSVGPYIKKKKKRRTPEMEPAFEPVPFFVPIKEEPKDYIE